MVEMPVVKCPIEGCEYETPDTDVVIAAALITTHERSHRAPSQPTQAARVEKVKRPSISPAGTTEDCMYFQSRWDAYVKATKLDGTEKVIQLLECCDEQLRKDLTRNAGGTLTGMTEVQVFKAMKILAIREENTMVARVALHKMKQGRDEPVRVFGARLRGQASVCKFTQKCTSCDANGNYTEAMVKDVLCRGLEDNEIQKDLLGDKNQDMSLEEALGFVEAKEAGKRSCCYPTRQTQRPGAPIGDKRKSRPRSTKPAHIVGPRDMQKPSNEDQEEGMPSLWHQVQPL